MSTPVSNHPAIITSPTTVVTEPLPDSNNRKRYFSGHRVQTGDRKNRQIQEDFTEQSCESKRSPKKRRCWQRVNTHPQAMVIGPGDDPSSFFSVEHLTEPLTEPPESSSVDQEPDHSEIIARFTATQQHQITSCLSHPGVKTVLSKACTLLQTLEQRGIQLSMDRSVPPLPTLFSKLKQFNIVTEHQACSRYFQKANVFFFGGEQNR